MDLDQVDNRPSMLTIWMNLAMMVARRSTCARLQVGAVIVSKDFEKVYSVGYNGGARGQQNKCESLEPGKCGHLHAEINALIKTNINDPKKILFITNLPCRVCAKAIVNARFSRVYYHEPYRDNGAVEILKQANIRVFHMPYAK